MCGHKFCGQCVNPAVIAWAEGEVHETPVFGDEAQKYLAIEKRQKSLVTALEMALAGDMVWARQFPELRHMLNARGISFAHLEGCNSIVEMPSYLRKPKPGASRKQRKRYHNRLRRWHAPFGGRYRALMRMAKRHMQREIGADPAPLALAA